jgi:hypothetical protein
MGRSARTGAVLDVLALRTFGRVPLRTSPVKCPGSNWWYSGTVGIVQSLDECIGGSLRRDSRVFRSKVPLDVAASAGGAWSCLEKPGNDAGAQTGAARW